MKYDFDLTIVIVNWNAGQALQTCLRSIQESRSTVRTQVIVVDNASTDGSPEQAQRDFPNLRLIHSGGNIGFGRANNLARPHANSEFVLFLNPDSLLHPGALDAMVAAIAKSPDVGAAGCKMRYADGRVWEQLVQRFPSPWTEFLGIIFASPVARRRLRSVFPYLDPHRSGYVSKLCGGCFLARKAVLDQVGWFDERYFMYAEDADLSRTILDHGWRLYYVSDAEISHVGGESSRKAIAEFPVLMHCESMAKLMDKYYGRGGAFTYRLGMLVGAGFRLLAVVGFAAAGCFIAKCRRFNLAQSGRKYGLVFQWGLGLKKPSIPGSLNAASS